MEKHIPEGKEFIQQQKYVERDGNLQSIWQSFRPGPEYTGKIGGAMPDQPVEVLIVGGGITGFTLGLLLQEAGKKCVIAEAYQPGYGTTGGTTAHINTMLDMPYPKIEKNFGADGAALVAEATRTARDIIAANVERYAIECDFAYKDGYLFAETEQEEKELEEIWHATQRAGVDAVRASAIPVPLAFRSAICYRKQARIHPLKYLYALAEAFYEKGGIVLTNTRVEHTERKDGFQEARTNRGALRAEQLVYATHIPLGINLLHSRCAPYRSYVLGVTLSDHQYPDDMAYDMKEPYHYFRTHRIADRPYLIIGGADHKTGHGDPEKSFQELETYTRQRFNVSSIDYHWSAQYFEPADGLPYIGGLPGGEEGVYVATGYSGNGILLGSLAGRMLADQILHKENPFAKLMSPSRIKPIAGFSDFVKENADVARRFVADRIGVDRLQSLADIEPEEGKIVNYENRQLAIYKSAEGDIRALHPVCSHAGCIVTWNNAEKSWDCPCHGGRFDTYGKVLTGPPREDLRQIISRKKD